MSDKLTKADSEKPVKPFRWLAHATGEGIVQWAVIKYGGYAMGLVVSAFFAILAYDTGLSWYWLIFMTVMVLYFLVNVVNKVVGWFQRPKNEIKGAEEVAGAKIEPLQVRAAELEAERDAAVRDRDTAVRERDDFKRRLEVEGNSVGAHSARATSLERYKWLHDIADKQVGAIHEYVQLLGDVEVFTEFLNNSLPSVRFGIQILNYSVFDITIDEPIQGHIEFGSQPLKGEKFFVYNDVKNRPYLNVGNLTIEQRLTKIEAEYIAASKDAADANFYFDKLIITIKGGERHPNVKEQTLSLTKQVHISGGKPVLRVSSSGVIDQSSEKMVAPEGDRPNNDQNLDTLIELAKEGAELLIRSLQHPDSTLPLHVIRWEKKTEDFIRGFNPAAGYLFGSNIGIERYPKPPSASHDSTLLDRVHTRLLRLDRIIEERRKA